jgi:hypothetical protein
MSCKIIRGDNYTAIRCKPDRSGGPNLKLIKMEEDEKAKHPYEKGECAHTRRFKRKGQFVCMDCPSVYDEDLLYWRPRNEL